MAQEIWLVIRDGKEYGPYSPQNLKDMAGKGQITPDDMVRRHDMAVPRQAKLLKGLFLAPSPSPQGGMKEVQASRPEKVEQALILLYGNLGIGLLLSVISIFQGFSDPIDTAILVGSSFGLFLTCFFYYMIGKGRNWARVTFLILFSLAVPLSVPSRLQSLQANPVIGLIEVAQIIMQVLALACLFEKSSSDWFRRMKGSRQSA